MNQWFRFQGTVYRLMSVALVALLSFVVMSLTLVQAAPRFQPPTNPDFEAYPLILPQSALTAVSFSKMVTASIAVAGASFDVAGQGGVVQWDYSSPLSEANLSDNFQNPGNVFSNYREYNNASQIDIAAGRDVFVYRSASATTLETELTSLINNATVMVVPVWDDSDCLSGGSCANALNGGTSNSGYTILTFARIIPTAVTCNGSACELAFRFLAFDGTSYQTPIFTQTVPLDVVLVVDRTGSMQFETICFDCWERNDDARYRVYPTNGTAYPLPYGNASAVVSSNYTSSITFNGTTYTNTTAMDYFVCGLDLASNAGCMDYCQNVGNGDACMSTSTGNPDIAASGPVAYDNDTPGTPDDDYIVLEAELYAFNNYTWDPVVRSPGEGYWALQRSNDNTASIDGKGAHVRHHPFRETGDSGIPFGQRYTLTEAQNRTAPRLEYDFIPAWSGQTNLYIRAMGLNETRFNAPPYNEIFWAVTSYSFPSTDNFLSGPASNTSASTTSGNDWAHEDDAWTWVSLGSLNLTQDTKYTLQLFAGSGGYSVDRIVIAGPTLTTTAQVSETIGIIVPPSPGSAQRVAVDRCNPIYGQTVSSSDCSPYYELSTSPVNNLLDPLFGDIQPLRGTQEAAKGVVSELDPANDQLGIVRLGSDAEQMTQLECQQAATVRRQVLDALTIDGDIVGWPLSSQVLGEFDETSCTASEQGVRPVRLQMALEGLENLSPAVGSTDIADGLRRGLNLLGIDTNDGVTHNNDCEWTFSNGQWLIDGLEQGEDGANPTSHCARPGIAEPILVLISNGSPSGGSPGDNNNCRNGPQGTVPDYGNPGDQQYDCVMYYAEIAAQNNIPVYPVGIGVDVDPFLLGAVAELTGGEYYYAPSYTELPPILSRGCIGCVAPQPELTISKAVSPVTATQTSLITYTLTITNRGAVTATNLLITDALPIGATYISGGSLVSDTIRWTVDSISAGQTTQVAMVVTASETITNVAYGVAAEGGSTAQNNGIQGV